MKGGVEAVRKICAWCGTSLGGDTTGAGAGDLVSHGVCKSCQERLMGDIGIPLETLLASLDAPVVLMDHEGVIREANPPALEVTGKPRASVENQLPGVVFECVHSREPGGCGRTIHCSGCTIRQTVERTLETGEPAVQVPATLKVGDPDRPGSIRFLISTTRVGNRILLRLELASAS